MSMRASGTISLQPRRHGLDVVDAVVDEVDLPAAVQLAHDRVPNQVVAEPRDARLDGEPVGRRRLQVRDARTPKQRHVQRPRDRRGRHRQHVDRRPQRLEPLLHLDAEPLLLVDDQQPEVRKLHVGRRQAMRADEDVELPVGRPLQNALAAPSACRTARGPRSRTGTRPSGPRTCGDAARRARSSAPAPPPGSRRRSP